MNADDAEEYTQSLGQIVAGSWRQIAWADRQGIPAALGLTTAEWVEDRLGGYVRLAIPERKVAVAELVEEGMTQREIASVLGVGQATVQRDLADSNESESAPDLRECGSPDSNESKHDGWEQPSFDDAAALLDQASAVADLVESVKSERRPKPTPAPPAHPAAAFLWARLSEVRSLNASTASPDQRPDIVEAIEMWSKEIDRLHQEVAP